MNDKPMTTGTTEADKNHTVKQKISRPKELILLFWIDEDWKGRTMMSESAQTRMNNIRKSSWYNENIHKIHCPPIQALHELNPIVTSWTNKYGGKGKVKTREIGVFSHSGNDGPITYRADIQLRQLQKCDNLGPKYIILSFFLSRSQIDQSGTEYRRARRCLGFGAYIYGGRKPGRRHKSYKFWSAC